MVQTIKIKNRNITLPPEIWRKWKGNEVIVRVSDDTIVIKKIGEADFWKTWRKMKKVSAGITKRDIEKAVSWAKKSKK